MNNFKVFVGALATVAIVWALVFLAVELHGQH